jgi:hypothetical protein
VDGEGGGSRFKEDSLPQIIPPSHLVFRWIPSDFVDKKTGRPTPNNFKGLDQGGVSVEWERYSDADKCKSHSMLSSEVGVVQLVVGEVRHIDQLKVEHRPEPEHAEHSLILGEHLDRDAKEAKVELANICVWARLPPS